MLDDAPSSSQQAQQALSSQRPGGRAAAVDDHTVTLITGDRVTLRNGAPAILPGPGRTRIKFSVTRDRGRVRVVPDDAAEMIANGQLDEALFDVSLLLDSGYGDLRRPDLPLIITRVPDPQGFARSAAGGVVVDRAMPALHAVSAHQPKTAGGAALAGLRSPGLARTAPSKIWLDRIRKPTLDHSVPQIGGTAAHARGFTGAGVTVAVLDTGIDSNHPDLAGKVVAAEDFTGDGGGLLDVVGHGTHVASIIAGTGAASNGQFAGVAPDAKLLSGRVCSIFGCPDSAILAGMQWAAAEQHAKIVNMSLGGGDTLDIDPLEDAVNQLSAEFGTLFVIAAGNDFFDATIESPGSADAALTVGAVDRDDQRAFFSSQGPRIGDEAVKPEVSAPGVDIVAARAAGVPPIGVPVGDSYMSLSGTSMATPHVAGAAALLVQQHADWTGTQLKAQLIATTQPNPVLTVFQQGAGRIDIDRGTRQDVSADPPVLSLGVVSFPHDDDPLIVRTVHYHNGGTDPVTLSLAATLALGAGGTAPPGMIQVEPSSVTVPAGGTSDATVTVTTSGDIADGLYSGALVATGGDIRVETPIGVDREVESFNLTIDVVDEQGAPSAASLFLINASGTPRFPFVNGHQTLRLAKGGYSFTASTFSFPGAFLAYPRLDLDADRTIVLDPRLAKPIAVEIGDPDVSLTSTGWEVDDLTRFYSSSSTAFGFSLPGGNLGPDAAPGEVIGSAVTTLSNAAVFGSPTLVYNLAHSERDHLPTGWTEKLSPDQIATVTSRHAGQDDAIYNRGAAPILVDPVQGLFGVGVSLLSAYSGPFERTDRYFGTDFVWLDHFIDNRALPGQDFPETVAEQFAFRAHPPGSTVTEAWNQATFGPGFPSSPAVIDGVITPISTALRDGNFL
ncbi:MAG TPA: S8 family serine peptidase, partial [Kofleriaceae bacterium]|nr:S8 family serine peptidase [Kofleriaceae bacterium]